MFQVFVTSVLMCISSDNYYAYHIHSVHIIEFKKTGTLLGDERNAVLLLGDKLRIVGYCARKEKVF